MPISESLFLRQLSNRGRKSISERWGNGRASGGWGSSLKEMEDMYNNGDENCNNFLGMKKRVMVVLDDSSYCKHALMWALNHVTNEGDILTLLHIVSGNSSSATDAYLATTLGSLCKASKPEVEVEALVIQGPKMGTVANQVKKLEVSVLVLGHKNPPRFLNCLCFIRSEREEFVEECISTLDCLTIGVQKQSNGIGGYLITTRWHKNFWLLA